MAENIDNELKQKKMSIISKISSSMKWNPQKEIGKKEIFYFLNKNSKDGQFDSNLTTKLLQYMGIEGDRNITVEDFINSYIQFEEELNQNMAELKKKNE
jgi:hypothetical protein